MRDLNGQPQRQDHHNIEIGGTSQVGSPIRAKQFTTAGRGQQPVCQLLPPFNFGIEINRCDFGSGLAESRKTPIIDRRYHTRGFSLITPENAESRILAGGEGGIEPRNPSVSIRSPGVRIKRPLMATKSAHAGVSRITPENTEGRDRRAG
jgi:hypothetical protein